MMRSSISYFQNPKKEDSYCVELKVWDLSAEEMEEVYEALLTLKKIMLLR
jgi:hypothetical protein